MSTNPTDYDALARRYLDLWQQEMAKLAQDPQAAGTWANLFQGMMQNATAAWSPAAAAPNTGTSYGQQPNSTSSTAAQAGPTSTAPSHRDGGVALADVLRRIDARLDSIEQRLAKLESQPVQSTPKTPRRTKQPKP